MKHLYTFNSNSPWNLLLKSILFSIPFIGGLVYFYIDFYIDFRNQKMGDLSNLGMMNLKCDHNSFNALQENLVHTITFEDVSNLHNDSIVMTIGDSFSQMGNRGYLNYIAHSHPEYKYINLQCPLDISPEDFFLKISIQYDCLPSIIILESVERHCVERLCCLQFNDIENSLKNNTNNTNNREEKKKSFIAWGQEYYKKKCGIDNPVGHYSLSKEMFSCKNNERELYFVNSEKHGSDLIKRDSLSIKIAQQKIDTLFQWAQAHNIEFYYMIALDKYDAYQEYIIEDHPINTALDILSKQFKNNKYFVNTKEILLPAIQNGEKDLYYVDDTHWSPKSAKMVGDELVRRIFNDKQ